MRDYIEKANRTKTTGYDGIRERLNSDSILDILHGGIGLATESGELLDALKKHIFYGKELDVVNVEEELGDLMWYIAIICHRLDVDFNDLMKKNIKKLSSRYPDKFTKEDALNRDLDKEREILEKI